MTRRWSLVALCLSALACLPDTRTPARQPQPKGRKVALLVGVGKFQHDMPDLKGAPQNDVDALKIALEQGGFEVVRLTDDRATKKNIENRFAALLDGGGDPRKALGKGDLLLTVLCSHGFTFDTPDPVTGAKQSTPFVAGFDALPGRPATMVSLNGLIETGKPFGATKLFLVDACREINDPNRGATRGIEGARAVLPKRTAVLFSCGQGELSHQPDGLGHGLFTHAVLRVLDGKTGLKDEVSWNELVAGVARDFRSAEFRKYIRPGQSQNPVAVTGETEDVPLLVPPSAAAVAPKTPDPKVIPPLPLPPKADITFAKSIVPIFKAKCTTCHGDVGKPKAGIDLRTLASALKSEGGNHPAVTPGDPAKSAVVLAVEDGSMPPAGKEGLTAAEKQLLRDWVKAGAKP